MDDLKLTKIDYNKLNARQKENYNFYKISGVLADYGFIAMRLSDDWHGADFMAYHIDGKTLIRVQLKTRLAFRKQYGGKDLFVAFRSGERWFLYPHDAVLAEVLEKTNLGNTDSWKLHGAYTFPGLGKDLLAILEPYRISG